MLEVTLDNEKRLITVSIPLDQYTCCIEMSEECFNCKLMSDIEQKTMEYDSIEVDELINHPIVFDKFLYQRCKSTIIEGISIRHVCHQCNTAVIRGFGTLKP